MEISCVLSSGYQLRKKRSNGCNNPKIPIGREPEFRDMNQFSGRNASSVSADPHLDVVQCQTGKAPLRDVHRMLAPPAFLRQVFGRVRQGREFEDGPSFSQKAAAVLDLDDPEADPAGGALDHPAILVPELETRAAISRMIADPDEDFSCSPMVF
jgi:hypothetical protein